MSCVARELRQKLMCRQNAWLMAQGFENERSRQLMTVPLNGTSLDTYFHANLLAIIDALS